MRVRKWLVLLGFSWVVAGLTGCATFSEVHYFASGPSTETERNYFRLKINGSARFSSARYISGYYDERAVDLFFNEMRGASTCTGNCSNPNEKIILENTKYDEYARDKSPGGMITPLDPDKHGALVMILSTNANVVSDTLGTFAESNVLADSVARLQHRDSLDRAEVITVTRSVDQARVTANQTRITDLIDAINVDPQKDAPTAQALWAELLAVARADSAH